MRLSWKTASVVAVALAAALAFGFMRYRPARTESAETQVSAAATETPATSSSSAAAPSASGKAGPMPLPPTVDLVALRKKIPDNLYWKVGVPPADAAEAQQRVAAEKANNALFGKVQSNTATEPEIREYYAYKRQLATDYVAFAHAVIADHGPDLTPDERNLYDLAIRMNEQRLKQLPREETLAVGRHRAYEAHKGTAR